MVYEKEILPMFVINNKKENWIYVKQKMGGGQVRKNFGIIR